MRVSSWCRGIYIVALLPEGVPPSPLLLRKVFILLALASYFHVKVFETKDLLVKY